MTPEEGYQRAAKVADQLLAWGLPVLRFGYDGYGESVWIQFKLEDAAYATRLPVLQATPEAFREAYQVVA